MEGGARSIADENHTRTPFPFDEKFVALSFTVKAFSVHEVQSLRQMTPEFCKASYLSATYKVWEVRKTCI